MLIFLALTVLLLPSCDLDRLFWGFLPRQCGALGETSQKLQPWGRTQSLRGGGGFRRSLFLISVTQSVCLCCYSAKLLGSVTRQRIPLQLSTNSRGLNSSTAWFGEVWILLKSYFFFLKSYFLRPISGHEGLSCFFWWQNSCPTLLAYGHHGSPSRLHQSSGSLIASHALPSLSFSPRNKLLISNPAFHRSTSTWLVLCFLCISIHHPFRLATHLSHTPL